MTTRPTGASASAARSPAIPLPTIRKSVVTTLFTGAGAPPPARTDADASPRLRLASARHGRRRFSLAPGPHPRRELTLMPRFGFTSPRLGMAAGAFHWRRGPPPARTDADASPRIHMSSARHGRRRFSLAPRPHPRRELTLMPRLGFTSPRLGMAAG